uniref:MITF_TFEB_C_3_N domain-containing protein n=1 Tax=Steinernema glaseri TaxID=37863 RepID=A0A1I7ZDG2_9BILA
MSNYICPGGYQPRQYVRSMYFAPQPAPQPVVQVVPVQSAPSEQQMSAILPAQGNVATGQCAPQQQPMPAPIQVSQRQASVPQFYQQASVVQEPVIQFRATRAPAPQPQNVPVFSMYAMNVPYQSTVRRVPSSYQYENRVQREVSEVAPSENPARQAARQQAQRQLEEAKAAYQHALENLTKLGSAAPSIEEIQAYQREQERLFQLQAALNSAPQAPQAPQLVHPPVHQIQAPVAVPVPAEPVYSSYGYEHGSAAQLGRLQKQMAESMYCGMPNNMVAAYAHPVQSSRSRTPSRQPSQQSMRSGAPLVRSNSTVTAIELREPVPKVATYKMASRTPEYVDREMQNVGRPIAPAMSEYHFETLRGPYAFDKVTGSRMGY